MPETTKPRKDKIVYFGPMGCRTGCYLLMAGDLDSKEIVPFITGMFEFVRDFEGELPGAAPMDCGNYLNTMWIWPNMWPIAIWKIRCTISTTHTFDLSGKG